MWNFVSSIGMAQPVPLLGHSSIQKRHFGLNFINLPIHPEKSFSNPNFVNKNHPNVHNNFISPYQKFCHTDNTTKKENIILSDIHSSLNSSIIDSINDQHLSTNKNLSPKQKIKGSNRPEMCCSRKRKKNRKNRRSKSSSKNAKVINKNMSEVMDVDLERDNCFNVSDINLGSRIPPLHLQDFIIEASNDSAESVSNKKPDDDLVTVISVSSGNKPYFRERLVSAAESEDSFIVFDSGTDEELDFSEETEESATSDNEEDLDSITSAIPTKRVRFADEDELCEIHPMIQWSFAYQQARKGPWEEYARDRDRFKKRICEIEKVLAPIFDTKHREIVFEERFQNY